MHLDMLWICTTLCVNKAMKDIVKAETSEEDLFMHCGSTGCPDFITTCLHTVWSLTVWMDNYLNWQCRFSGTPPFPPPLKNMKERHNMVGFEEIEYGGEACHFGAVPVLRKTLQCRWWCFIPRYWVLKLVGAFMLTTLQRQWCISLSPLSLRRFCLSVL